MVRLDKNVTESQRPLIDAFVEFLWSRQAQQIFVDYGFRSPIEELNQVNPHFGVIESRFTLDSLGGPRQAQRTVARSTRPPSTKVPFVLP